MPAAYAQCGLRCSPGAAHYTGEEAHPRMPLNAEPSLSCPKCGASIALTESLAAPLVAATRAQYEQRLSDQANAFAAEKQAVNAQGEANRRRAAELATGGERRSHRHSGVRILTPTISVPVQGSGAA